MMGWRTFVVPVCVLMFMTTYQSVDAQENLAQETYAIFEQSCLNCHGPHGSFTEQLVIQSRQELIDTGKVIPGNPDSSIFYQRLIETAVEKRMPLGQPPLSPAAIETIRQWIQAGAPDWNAFARTDIDFITTEEMLQTIENHLASLDPFDRTFARYFTSTHLYNAGETTETLRAYQRALSKLINSLSWGREVTQPQPINSHATIFYIDLRDYEWEIGTNRWTLIETEYSYNNNFDAPTQTALREKLTNLRAEMSCEVPFVYVDWFLATASLPPLYHDILDLPLTDSELEARLEVNVVENIRNAAGRRVWRAGFNDSGVSNHNRVVERHLSRYGAYWKSYDFAGSVGAQNIFTHPLDFTHDGGEIIFNLPNGLQAYYLADAGGNRLDEAPISIVSNPAVSDPTVRNGLSCIGCHTEGMKSFENQVRAVVEQNENPPFDKAQALRLYVENIEMEALVEEDTARYRQALEAAGGVFGGIEPVQRFHEAFQGPVDAAYAAAAVGLETEVFLEKIRGNTSLQNLGLLVLENGTIKRDTWTTNFSAVVSALNTPDSTLPPVVQRPELIPGQSVNIPDPNLRAAISEALGKAPGAPITAEEMETLEVIDAEGKDISDLTGLEFATNIYFIKLSDNNISDLSTIAGLTRLQFLGFDENRVSDLSPLAGLSNLNNLSFAHNQVSDLSPLAGLTKLEVIHVTENGISDLTPLAGLPNLKDFLSWSNPLSDLSPLVGLEYINICGESPDISTLKGATNLRELYLLDCDVSDLSALADLTDLERLSLQDNKVSDVSPLSGLTNLKWLDLQKNKVSDVSPLAELTNLKWLNLRENKVSDVSPLVDLTHLKWVNLNNNEITDFSPLEGLRETTSIMRLFNPGSPNGGPKIEGPWLWVIAPIGEPRDVAEAAPASGIDFLAEMSGGKVTELKVAAEGAGEGNPVGNSVWTAHKIPPTGPENIRDMVNAAGLKTGDTHFVAYGVVNLDSPQHQATNMFVGSGDAFKVWLNGELVYNHPTEPPVAESYLDVIPVTLEQGKNVLLVALYRIGGAWSGFFGFEEGTEYMVANPGVVSTFSEDTIYAGDIFTVNLNAENVYDLSGWQFDIDYDPEVLEAVEVNEGDFLKEGGGTTFFQKGTIDNTTGKITKLSSARLNEDGATGTGTLLSVTFIAKTGGETQVALENFQLGAITGETINAGPHEVTFTIEGQLATGDVNRDGQVSILDLILVSRHLGEDASANPQADVNNDGIINIQDLIVVAQHLGESTDAAAPSLIAAIDNGELTPARVQAWITQAQIEDDGSIAFQQGIATLERLLTLFIPDETALLYNYPNPFNPETWIPYRLAKPTEVTLTIYATNGAIIRTLKLGHQPAGFYESRTRAAYWDGKNEVGEPVASGIYFYTLTAGDFNATRKMLIRK